jgi:hypothetical protein
MYVCMYVCMLCLLTVGMLYCYIQYKALYQKQDMLSL